MTTTTDIDSTIARLATLDDADLASLDAWWRANNYLTVGQIYLMDNPLLREPLMPRTSSRGCSVTGAPARGCPSSTPTPPA
jgi:phosphoketolase